MSETRPVSLLVVQLSRLGDTLQSLMALRAAKQLYPQLEIHFLARKSFAVAAQRVPWIEKVHVLPTDEIVAPLASHKESEEEALKKLARWIAPIATRPWDLLFNWSYSEASSYLTAILPARAKLGFTRREDLSAVTVDGWSHYVQAIVQGGIHQNIHLTDILTTQLLTALQIHVGDPSEEAANTPATSRGFFSLDIAPTALTSLMRESSRRWIGLQIGSGNLDRTWPASAWSAFISKTLTYGTDVNIVLMGGPDDIEKEREILSLLPDSEKKSPFLHSIVGQAGFDQWATVVSRCQWVVAGDTAVVPLASVLGTRVLHLSLHSPKWIETGPYGNGHYVLTPSGDTQTIDPEAAFLTWTYAAGEWASRKLGSIEDHFAAKKCADALTKISIFRSKIRSSQDGGGVVYEPMNRQALSLTDWSAQVVGHVARAWYCGWVPSVGTEIDRRGIGPTLVQNLRRLSEAADVLAKICEEARRTSAELQARGARLRSDRVMGLSDQDELRSLAKKLMDLEDLIDRLAGADPLLLAFSRMARVLMHNLRGDRLVALGKESARSYQQILQGISVMKEWIDHTQKMVRPIAVQPAKVIEFPGTNRPSPTL